MSLFLFLMVVQAIVAALLVGVILMQKSEGGGLGTGGSPSGFMSARGAADFMTRTTAVLAVIFVALSIALAALAVNTTGARTIDTSLQREAVPAQQQAPVNPLDPAAQAPVNPLDPAAQPAVPVSPAT